jgi:hypothetical protein
LREHESRALGSTKYQPVYLEPESGAAPTCTEAEAMAGVLLDCLFPLNLEASASVEVCEEDE